MSISVQVKLVGIENLQTVRFVWNASSISIPSATHAPTPLPTFSSIPSKVTNDSQFAELARTGQLYSLKLDIASSLCDESITNLEAESENGKKLLSTLARFGTRVESRLLKIYFHSKESEEIKGSLPWWLKGYPTKFSVPLDLYQYRRGLL